MREKKPVDRMEMLYLLGHLYAETAAGFGKVNLQRTINDAGAESIMTRRNLVMRSILRTGLMKLSVNDRRPRRTYKWNLKDYGPPTLLIADMIINDMALLNREKALASYRRRRVNVDNSL